MSDSANMRTIWWGRIWPEKATAPKVILDSWVHEMGLRYLWRRASQLPSEACIGPLGGPIRRLVRPFVELV